MTPHKLWIKQGASGCELNKVRQSFPSLLWCVLFNSHPNESCLIQSGRALRCPFWVQSLLNIPTWIAEVDVLYALMRYFQMCFMEN